MAEYNASDTRHIRRAAKEAKALDADRRHIILKLMSDPAGRSWMHSRLVRAHCFTTSFSPDALVMAFAEGERNIGLQDLNDLMQFAPDQYIQMMREASDRRISDDNRSDRRSANGDGRDSGPIPDGPVAGIDAEYEPGSDLVGPDAGSGEV